MNAAYLLAHSWLTQPAFIYHSGPHVKSWYHSQPASPYTPFHHSSRKMPDIPAYRPVLQRHFLNEFIFQNDPSLVPVDIETNQHDTFGQDLEQDEELVPLQHQSELYRQLILSFLALSCDIIASCCCKSLALWFFLPTGLGTKCALFQHCFTFLEMVLESLKVFRNGKEHKVVFKNKDR